MEIETQIVPSLFLKLEIALALSSPSCARWTKPSYFRPWIRLTELNQYLSSLEMQVKTTTAHLTVSLPQAQSIQEISIQSLVPCEI